MRSLQPTCETSDGHFYARATVVYWAVHCGRSPHHSQSLRAAGIQRWGWVCQLQQWKDAISSYWRRPVRHFDFTGQRLTASTMTLATRWLLSTTVVMVWLSSWNDAITTPLMAAAAASVLRGVPDEQRLLTKIQRNYDGRVRPVYNSTHTVTVKFALTLVQIIDVVWFHFIVSTHSTVASLINVYCLNHSRSKELTLADRCVLANCIPLDELAANLLLTIATISEFTYEPFCHWPIIKKIVSYRVVDVDVRWKRAQVYSLFSRLFSTSKLV